MDIKLNALITISVSFLLSLCIEGVRSFLLKLPSRILKHFRDRNFKHCILSLEDTKDIKELGKYCFCSFDKKIYIINSRFLSEEVIENQTVINLNPPSSFQKTEISEIETKEGLNLNVRQERDLTNKQVIDILDKFFQIDENKRHCFLSETLYMAIKSKLQKRKVNLIICLSNKQFEKIPFKKLSERDFNCPDSKLSIEIKL